MHIGIDARLWNESGVGRYIRNLVSQLQKIDQKNNYTLFVRGRDYENIKYQISPVRQAQGKFQIVKADIQWHTIAEQITFPKIIDKENLDLVHFPYFSVPVSYNKPFVVTIHDLILHHFPTGEASTLPPPMYFAKRIGYKYIISQAAKKAQKIIAVSQATKDEIIKQLNASENKIVVTYEGVDPALASENYTEPDIKKPFFLYVGNAYPHKNLEKLVEAFFYLLQKQTDPLLTLVLVGRQDYFYKKLMKKINKNPLSKAVIHLPDIQDNVLSGLYKKAIATVVPSLMEGFSLPALEAMGHGCLVVGSSIPSIQEICGKAAVYFNPNDKESIAQALIDVWQHLPTYEQKKKEGEARAKMFSWSKMAEETIKVYESSLSI